MITSHFGAVVAGGELIAALNNQLASTQSPSDTVQMGISFRNREGQYCRTFEIDQSHAAGLACNDGRDWRIRLLTPSERHPSGEYRQAGTAMPAAVLERVEQEIAGEALDAEAEAAARAAHWRH
jgi:hypothetical protein